MDLIDNNNVSTESIGDIQMPQATFVRNEIFLIARDNCISIADRTLLARCSNYFREKFNGPDADDFAIKLDFVDGKTLEILLDFYYTGTIHINASNVAIIFNAAKILRFMEILDKCGDLFLANLNEKSVWICMKIGESHNLQKMVNVTHAFAIKNFPKVVQCTAEFVQLNAKQLAAFLRDDNLCVESESDAFGAMIKWLMHSYTDRLQFIPELLRSIRLTQLSMKFLTKNAAFLAKEAKCLPLIHEAISWIKDDPTTRKKRLLAFNPRPRRNAAIDMNLSAVQFVKNDDGNSTSIINVELYNQNRENERQMVTFNAV